MLEPTLCWHIQEEKTKTSTKVCRTKTSKTPHNNCDINRYPRRRPVHVDHGLRILVNLFTITNWLLRTRWLERVTLKQNLLYDRCMVKILHILGGDEQSLQWFLEIKLIVLVNTTFCAHIATRNFGKLVEITFAEIFASVMCHSQHCSQKIASVAQFVLHAVHGHR